MKPIHLIPLATPVLPNVGQAVPTIVGQTLPPANPNGNGATPEPGLDLLEHLAATLARTFRTPCRIRPLDFDLSFAIDERRNQFYSTAILQRLERAADPDARVLAVTSCDLYVPVLTFVFGEAQLDGNCAVVSTARLKDDFYGLPPSTDLLRDRLAKEAAHELGHTFGLRHCADWRCVMSSSHAVERLDVKGADFCKTCGKTVLQNGYW